MPEGAVCKKLPVVVARAVVSPTDCSLDARLLNPTAEVVWVHRGTRLEQVERVADTAVASMIMEGQSGGEAVPEERASDQTLSGMVSQQDTSGFMQNPIQQEQLLQVTQRPSLFMASATPWQGIAFPITGQAVSMDAIKLPHTI